MQREPEVQPPERSHLGMLPGEVAVRTNDLAICIWGEVIPEDV